MFSIYVYLYMKNNSLIPLSPRRSYLLAFFIAYFCLRFLGLFLSHLQPVQILLPLIVHP
jgi:hypothetical protein